MGLLYEYSSTDNRSYRRALSTAPLLPEEPSPPTSSEPSEPTETSYTGGDIAIASLVMMGVFLVLMFASLFVFTFAVVLQNPALIETDDIQAATEAIIAPYEEAYALQYVYLAFLYGASLLAGVTFVAFRAGWGWHKLGIQPLTKRGLAYAITMGAIGGTAIMGGVLVGRGSAGLLDDQVMALSTAFQQASPSLVAGAALLFVLVLPMVQELFFRGVVHNYLRSRMGFIGALLVSSLVYASLNLNPTSFLTNFALGGALALVFERTGSIWGAVLAHITFNTLTVIMYLTLMNIF